MGEPWVKMPIVFGIQQHKAFSTEANLLVLFAPAVDVCISFIKMALELP